MFPESHGVYEAKWLAHQRLVNGPRQRNQILIPVWSVVARRCDHLAIPATARPADPAGAIKARRSVSGGEGVSVMLIRAIRRRLCAAVSCRIEPGRPRGLAAAHSAWRDVGLAEYRTQAVQTRLPQVELVHALAG